LLVGHRGQNDDAFVFGHARLHAEVARL